MCALIETDTVIAFQIPEGQNSDTGCVINIERTRQGKFPILIQSH